MSTVPTPPAVVKSPRKSPTPITIGGPLETALHALNNRYVYVTQMAAVVRIPTLSHPEIDIYAPSVFTSSLERDKINTIPVARCWIDWRQRREVYKLAYEPGQPAITANGNLNTWMPSRTKAIEGDVTLWLDYLDRIFATDPTYRDWFLAWLAYPIQHPGAKLHTAVVFWSEQTATGKSMLGRIMSHIYGQQNYAQIDESTLHNPFNFWANGRQFVMGEEIKGSSSAKYADRLKAMITQQVIYVNIKQKAQFELRDCLNYYFTSNHPDAFYLDSNDRRFFVHNLGDKKYPADLYRDHFEPWALNGGYEAIRYYLEHIDLIKPIVGGDPTSLTPRRFNPGAAAPQSSARKQMILANRDDAEEWLDELIDCPQNVLNGLAWTLATAQDLYDLFYEANKRTKLGPKAFSARLRQRTFPLYSDNKLTLSSGKRVKVYPIGEAGKVHKDQSGLSIVSDYESQH